MIVNGKQLLAASPIVGMLTGKEKAGGFCTITGLCKMQLVNPHGFTTNDHKWTNITRGSTNQKYGANKANSIWRNLWLF